MQVNGVAIGSKIGPNYANLFVGYVEEQIFNQFDGPTPDKLLRQLHSVTGPLKNYATHHRMIEVYTLEITLLFLCTVTRPCGRQTFHANSNLFVPLMCTNIAVEWNNILAIVVLHEFIYILSSVHVKNLLPGCCVCRSENG